MARRTGGASLVRRQSPWMICLYLVLLFACPMLLAGTARAQEDTQTPLTEETSVTGPSMSTKLSGLAVVDVNGVA